MGTWCARRPDDEGFHVIMLSQPQAGTRVILSALAAVSETDGRLRS